MRWAKFVLLFAHNSKEKKSAVAPCVCVCRLTCRQTSINRFQMGDQQRKNATKKSHALCLSLSSLPFAMRYSGFGSDLIWLGLDGGCKYTSIVLKTKPDDTALLGGVQPSSPISKTSSPSSSMTHNSISNCSGETTSTNKYATNHLNDITVSIVATLTNAIWTTHTLTPLSLSQNRLNLTNNLSFTRTPLCSISTLCVSSLSLSLSAIIHITFTCATQPLDDTTTPLFGEIFDELILPDGYCTLLSDDINPIDAQSKMNIIDPFINYRDEMCETAETSSGILSPDNLSKVCIKAPACVSWWIWHPSFFGGIACNVFVRFHFAVIILSTNVDFFQHHFKSKSFLQDRISLIIWFVKHLRRIWRHEECNPPGTLHLNSTTGSYSFRFLLNTFFSVSFHLDLNLEWFWRNQFVVARYRAQKEAAVYHRCAVQIRWVTAMNLHLCRPAWIIRILICRCELHIFQWTKATICHCSPRIWCGVHFRMNWVCTKT